MSLPVTNDLDGLEFVYNGSPFVYAESKDTLNTVTLDFVFNGVPFVAAYGNSPLPGSSFDATRMFMIF